MSDDQQCMGRSEMKGFKALGFTFVYNGKDIEHGIELLYIHKEVLRQVLGDTSIYGYQDLWKVGGVVERAARRADRIVRSSALEYLSESLKRPQRTGAGVRAC
jgi:hypothetical protein